MEKIPDKVLIEIFKFLELNDIYKCKTSCKKFFNVLENEYVLGSIFKNVLKEYELVNFTDSGLKNSKDITVLRLYKNEIQKIEGLENPTQLTELNLCWNKIKEIEGLEKLIQLKELNLSRNQIQMKECLEKLRELNLKRVDL